jgi:hypothetical protein
MYLNETYSRFQIGKYLSDMFPIKIGLQRGDNLTPFLFKFALECKIRRVQINQDGLTSDCTHQFLVYAHDVNVFDEAAC